MKDIKSNIQKQFGQTAENYRHSRVHATGADLEWLANEIAQQTDAKKILDVGCGAGHTSKAVAPHAEEVIALDLTEAMLDQVQILAQENGLYNISTKLGDVENLPFDDASFDVVVTRYSAHHWANPQQAINEIARVLKVNGRVVLIDVIGFDSFAADTFLQSIELLRDLSHVRDHTIAQWYTMFQSAGLTLSGQQQWALPLDFDAWVKRMAVPPSRIAMIRELFTHTSDDIREALDYQETAFSLQSALFDMRKMN